MKLYTENIDGSKEQMKSAKREMKCFALNCKCFNYFLICDQDSFVIVNANWSLFKFTKFTTSKRIGDIKKVIEKKLLKYRPIKCRSTGKLSLKNIQKHVFP